MTINEVFAVATPLILTVTGVVVYKYKIQQKQLKGERFRRRNEYAMLCSPRQAVRVSE